MKEKVSGFPLWIFLSLVFYFSNWMARVLRSRVFFRGFMFLLVAVVG